MHLCEMATEEGVRGFLDGLGLGRYWEIFKAKGYDRESDIPDLDEEDLATMHISGNDRRLILDHACRFRPSESFHLRCWLEKHGLGYYEESFRMNDHTSLNDLERLQLSEQVFDELEMHVPAHRKRLKRAVLQLRKRSRLEPDPDQPIARGYWGKPTPLHYAKNDFLCLHASLTSTTPERKQVDLEFMVDSGSDVVTVREEVLQQLGLELIGTIASRGVHATREKQLYRAFITVGDVQVETEVMSETYDSIGNQVLRNFRHSIDAHNHFWMRSDIRFLPPSFFERQEPVPAGEQQSSGVRSPVSSSSLPPGVGSRATQETGQSGESSSQTPGQSETFRLQHKRGMEQFLSQSVPWEQSAITSPSEQAATPSTSSTQPTISREEPHDSRANLINAYNNL